jgi:hypothetical protein
VSICEELFCRTYTIVEGGEQYDGYTQARHEAKDSDQAKDSQEDRPSRKEDHQAKDSQEATLEGLFSLCTYKGQSR